MTAQECYDNVMIRRKAKQKQERENVFAMILQAVEANELGVQTGPMSYELQMELQESGFHVTAGAQYNESYTNISWDQTK